MVARQPWIVAKWHHLMRVLVIEYEQLLWSSQLTKYYNTYVNEKDHTYLHTKGNSMCYWSIYLFFVLFSPWSLHTTHSADVSYGLFLGAPFLCQKDHGENSHNWHLIQYQRELSRGQKHSLSLSIHLLQINHILSLWVFQK